MLLFVMMSASDDETAKIIIKVNMIIMESQEIPQNKYSRKGDLDICQW